MPGTAQAAPNCTIAHDLHPYSDNEGGAWQLELDARCTELMQSGTFGIQWMVTFWAEPQGGGDWSAEFSRGKVEGFPQMFESRGSSNFVQLAAPLGYGRYCYYAQAYFKGFPSFISGDMVKNTGRHCVDT